MNRVFLGSLEVVLIDCGSGVPTNRLARLLLVCWFVNVYWNSEVVCGSIVLKFIFYEIMN